MSAYDHKAKGKCTEDVEFELFSCLSFTSCFAFLHTQLMAFSY